MEMMMSVFDYDRIVVGMSGWEGWTETSNKVSPDLPKN